MINLNENIVFWIEDFDGVKKLSYGFVNPDEIYLDKKILIDNQADFLKSNINLKNYNKLHLYEQNVFSDAHTTNYGDDVLLEGEYEQEMVKHFVKRFKKTKSHITIKKINSDKPSEIAVFNGVLLLLPKNYELLKLSNYLLTICQK